VNIVRSALEDGYLTSGELDDLKRYC
jgi:hypothetical protein